MERQEIMRYSEQQRAYNQARQASELAGAMASAHERAFLAARGATDRRGQPARCLWQIENDAVFDALEAEYQADPEAVKLQKDDMAARAALIKAERDLVAWALSIPPGSVPLLPPPPKRTTPPEKRSLIWPCDWTPLPYPAAVPAVPLLGKLYGGRPLTRGPLSFTIIPRRCFLWKIAMLS